MNSQDTASDLPVTYRRVLKNGHLASRFTLLTRGPSHGLRPSLVEAVIKHDGSLVNPEDYSLVPYDSHWGPGGTLYWKNPMQTAGLTILFQCSKREFGRKSHRRVRSYSLDIEHGTVSGYAYRLCRCASCSRANALYRKAQRAKKKDQERSGYHLGMSGLPASDY